MKLPSIILVFALAACNYVNAQADTKAPISIGESLQIQSEILSEYRTVNVYLPPSYDADSASLYPVVYLLDGALDEDFIHIVGNVQFCSFPWIKIMPESIVVGIANVDRKRDFTYPSTIPIDRTEFPTSGGAAEFIAFIAQELQPYIQTNYRTADKSTIIGQSLGGLLATQILFDQPELFDNYIIVSPSLWWDDEKILERALDRSLQDNSIYIAVGNEGPRMRRLAQTLYHKLSIEKGGEAALHYKYLDQQDHGDALHLAVYDAFGMIFKTE